MGWLAAIGMQLAVFALIVWLSQQIERRRAAPETSPPLTPQFTLLRGPWPLLAGAVGLAVLNGLTLFLAGHPWSITWAFSLWGGKVMQGVGYDLSQTTFWSGSFQQNALGASILADTTSVMNIGLVLGAALAAGLAGRFAPTLRIPLRAVGIALFGGLLLGYGARIAYGCNIGAYFSGVASTSLHGWLWLAGALLGTPIGIRLRAILERGRVY
ncbi:MAG: hypothetical protein ETSY1_44765 [Candidatus Entotheonella factor]|uniref:Uncharacterized protein n=1 Tax=Entotheonella factor TaxID=1429438 RepID=W4L275_ENTF1|nr:MAG: hypothetical protein ETSY1_44765 [Candidatus Entotheonella factor]